MICPQMSQNTHMSVFYLRHQRNLREFFPGNLSSACKKNFFILFLTLAVAVLKP